MAAAACWVVLGVLLVWAWLAAKRRASLGALTLLCQAPQCSNILANSADWTKIPGVAGEGDLHRLRQDGRWLRQPGQAGGARLEGGDLGDGTRRAGARPPRRARDEHDGRRP